MRHPSSSFGRAVAGVVLGSCCAIFCATAASAEVVITTSAERLAPLPKASVEAGSVEAAPVGAGSVETESAETSNRLSQKTGEPSDGEFFFPWILDDTQGSLGPATVYAIRNEGLDFSPVDVQVQFFDEFNQLILEDNITTIRPNASFPRTVRDQRDLIDDNRVARGIARMQPTGPISVDYFEVDYGNDFASGGLAYTPDDYCVHWTARYLRFAPSVEGSEMMFIVNGPLGMQNNPSIEGEVFNQRGDFVQSFQIQTDQSLVVVESQSLTAGVEFGSMEVRFVTDPAEGGGIVAVLHRAFERFSVGYGAVCTDSLQG